MKKGNMKWVIIAVIAVVAYMNWDKIKKMLKIGETDTTSADTAKAMEIEADINDEV